MGMGNAFGSGPYGMEYCLPRLDEGLSALFDDLTERGLMDDTLVVVMGEFGRSPKTQTKELLVASTGRNVFLRHHGRLRHRWWRRLWQVR